MPQSKSWWRRLDGAPRSLTGPDGGLRAPGPGAVRLELLFLAALSVATGIITQASLLLVPLGGALLLLCSLSPQQLRGVVAGGGGSGSGTPAASPGKAGRTDWS